MDEYTYFISLVFGFGLLAGFVAFLVYRKELAKWWVVVLLASSAVLIGLGTGETFLWVIEKINLGPRYPEPPDFILKRGSASHHLVQNSILYIEPPNSLFRTVGHIYRTNKFIEIQNLQDFETHFNINATFVKIMAFRVRWNAALF